ncbi:MAG: hypothetical protein A2931_02270 [Candidatus Niyogibacteria bacterium RIFCSPLOWO2_01_FULL_45_48]|uniref:DUF35 domain-containing protein n=2 Tax=Candidatus Niyogiibacteriota TaxID=1817912 RepID=A0A1G2EZK4_9BACT|nr:MAG: hypothetical protein A2835_01590 [Candidatus Niyogibacteria bacterium RIFCSPHIGHO2_01_FULL_45_28]OGZ30771.1 MAG: hypothetical protein A3J00_03950 [Candidatus Niyogibacteria bacterium RIFCSPLOWO2_02_FULL_45_13]OGZ31289.1 MAG: hypothetical protein A2931_02270 [Candidatus Niyogibacteria bacterium RIFCSPLOWO2_01_FULL_45_48]
MANNKKNWVIPESMWPEKNIERVRGRDGKDYLVQNDVMFTGVKHTRGEFSRFFIELCDNARILAHRCPRCRKIIVPPSEQRCPQCNFVEMVEEYVRDVGVMVATPVITAFPPSRFKEEIPFGSGYVFLETNGGGLTDQALAVRVKTTAGSIRPGIFTRGTPVKIVFCHERLGEILDVFAVPQSELTPEQIARSPLFEYSLVWTDAAKLAASDEPVFKETLERCVRLFCQLRDKISLSSRARENLKGWLRVVDIKTPGGSFQLRFYTESFVVTRNPENDVQLTFIINEPELLLNWLEDSMKGENEKLESPALTDLVLEGKIIMDKPELETINRLDRIPRSLRRDRVI